MTPIPIPIMPQLARYVVGEIMTDPDHLILSEDMVEIDLPNGVLIYAGWYERGTAQGAYRIYADYELERLIPYIETDDPYQAAMEVAILAEQYAHHPCHLSDAESTVSVA